MYKIKKKYLHEFVKHLVDVKDEAIVYFEEDGMKAKVVDVNHIYLVEMFIQKEAFETYEVTEKVGVNLEVVKKFIKSFDFEDEINVGFIEKEKIDFLKLTSQYKDLHTLTSVRPLVDMNSINEPSPPELDLPVKFEMANESLRVMTNYLEECYGADEHVEIVFEDDMISLEYDNVENENDSMVLNKVKILESVEHCVKSLFAVDFMKDMSIRIRKSTDLKMTIGKDYPVVVEFEACDDLVKGKYMIAPRIESS